jgi:hypothetical protein
MLSLFKGALLTFAYQTTSAMQLSAAKNTWKLAMAPRRQWEANAGYCGETSTISALLYYGGGYMSQYDMRVAASPNTTDTQTDTQYLLADNDLKCAKNVKLLAQEWNSTNGDVN